MKQVSFKIELNLRSSARGKEVGIVLGKEKEILLDSPPTSSPAV